MIRALRGLAALVLALGVGPSAVAQDSLRDTYGEVGMLDMPSAHMAQDGELGFTLGDVGAVQRYSLSFQFLPWLDTSFRYSHVAPGWAYWDRSFGMKARLFQEGDLMPDVSLGIRDILGTGRYSAEYLVASKHIGPVDLTAGMGWGRLAGTGTIPNPLGELFSSFKQRTDAREPTGGTVNFSQFFHGRNVGIFGGVVWQTPISGLKLVSEFSSDSYNFERKLGGIDVRSPVNVGLSYRPFDFVSLSAGWFYGTTYGFTVSVRGDPKDSPSSAMRIGPRPLPPAIRSDADQAVALRLMIGGGANAPSAFREEDQGTIPVRQALMTLGENVGDVERFRTSLVIDAHRDPAASDQCARYAQIARVVGTDAAWVAMTDFDTTDAVFFCGIQPSAASALYTVADGQGAREPAPSGLEAAVRAAMKAQRLELDAFAVSGSELWLYYRNNQYGRESEAIGRITRILMAAAPPAVEVFHIVSVSVGLPMRQVTVFRSALERVIAADGTPHELLPSLTVEGAPMKNPALSAASGDLYPKFDYSFGPRLTERFFDPDRPLQFMIYGDAAASVEFAPGLFLGTELSGSIWNDYTFTRPPESVLPHVRSDVLQYLKHGKYGITNLQLIYLTRLTPEVFVQAQAGYLEDMYMGGGGQVLWRPDGSRFAFGADLYQVWKRDFNRLFGIQKYNITTGHVSVYYQSPWYDLDFAVHAGRYLAGDWGGTIEISRRFSSGVEVGAWATFTNVPFSRFGEGSFDKGIFIHIPFEWGLPIWSRSSYDLHLNSLTRDGGQRLSGDDSLHYFTSDTSDGEILDHIDDLVRP